jgi:N-acyl homoserine lactone hydrolase
MKGIELHVLECGRTSLDHELAVTGHPDEIVTARRPEGARRLLRHPIYAYVIEHPSGRILVDTGVSTSYQQEWKEGFYKDAMFYDPGPDGLFVQRLEQRGLSPRDFDYVVVTHLHTDHAGNVRLFVDTPARILIGQDELRGAVRSKGGLLRDDLVSVWGVTSPQGFTRADWACLLPDRAIEVWGDFELLEDIWVVTLPGHTWGTVGVAVRLERDGWVLMASDAIYLAATWGQKRFANSLLNHFPEEWARSAVKCRRLFEHYGMTVLPGHDETVIVPDSDEGYRLAPLKPVYQ